LRHKIDARAYYVYDAYDDINADDIEEAYRTGDFKENLKKLYEDADRRAHENYENAVGDYELDDPYFRPVPVRVFENFNKEADEDIDGDGTRDSGIRVYINRDDIDLYCIMDGRPAETADEIMIDRMHADNRGIKTGDRIIVNGEEFTVSGSALTAGILLQPSYRGTGYDKNQRTQSDYGSNIYVIRELET
jgi:putative ABC transport system permease protein